MDQTILTQILIFCGVAFAVYWGSHFFDGNAGRRLPGILNLAAPLNILLTDNGMPRLLIQMFPARAARYEMLISRMDGRFSAADVFASQLSFGLYGGIAAGITVAGLSLDGGTGAFVLISLPAAGWLYPVMYISRKAEQRSEQVLSKLSFAIDLICSSMGAGLDFCSAVRYLVSMDSDNPLRYEFQLFLRQIELGNTRLQALNYIKNRLQLPEFSRFVASVAQSLDSGSSVLDIMRIQSDEIRSERFVRAEREVAKAPVKMIIPMAIFIFPAMFVIIITPIFLKVKDSGMFTTFFK